MSFKQKLVTRKLSTKDAVKGLPLPCMRGQLVSISSSYLFYSRKGRDSRGRSQGICQWLFQVARQHICRKGHGQKRYPQLSALASKLKANSGQTTLMQRKWKKQNDVLEGQHGCKCAFLTKCEVKIAGYLVSSFWRLYGLRRRVLNLTKALDWLSCSMRTYYIAELFCLYKNQEWLVFFQALEKKANCDGECSFYIWQSVLTVFCRFLRLLCRHWLNITNFVSLRNAIFYLTRDKSVISQASKSSGRLSEHRTSFILPGGTPSCIIYIIGRAWKKHRAV